jgi:parallel beta-helix repeat protein
MTLIDIVGRSLGKGFSMMLALMIVVPLISAGITFTAGASDEAYVLHDPINVDGEAGLIKMKAKGECHGSGTLEDPYVIEGFKIIAGDGSGIGLVLVKTHLIIRDCYLQGGIYGIVLRDSSNVIVTNNICLDNAQYSIFLLSSSNNTITNNQCISSGGSCIDVGLSDRNIVSANTCILAKDGSGINVWGSNANVVSNNTCNGNSLYGIYIAGSSGHQLSGNTCTNNSYSGIHILESEGAVVTNNACNGNGQYGIYLIKASRNTISHNTCLSNVNGIRLFYAANGNLLFGNLLMGNQLQASDNSTNSWNTELYGNYWGDLVTPDANKDGIIDTSYSIANGANVDRLPLALPTVAFTSLSPIAYTNNDIVDISGIASGYGISTVTWYNAATGESDACSGTTEWSSEVTVAQGANRITVTVIDANGRTSVVSAMIFRDITTPGVDRVSITSTATVQFSEMMNKSSMLFNVSNVPGTLSWIGSTAVFTPDSPLNYDATYSVNMSCKDLIGNPVHYEWSFTTVKNECTISGIVKDADGNVVANATITLSNGVSTTTDADGRFELTAVPSGSYTLTITKDGFQTISTAVDAVAGSTVPMGSMSLRTSDPGSSVPIILIGAIAVILAALAISILVLRHRKA